MKLTDAEKIFVLLEKDFPNAHCELNYSTTFELLVAVILSAQCTDKRVNQITPALFEKYSSPRDFASAPQEELEKLIYSCGFYHNKAKNIIAAANAIVKDYGGKVPDTFDGLLSLPGVGRKTANVVFSVGYGGDGIAVDTHVFRTAHRLNLSDGKTPFDVEKDLMKAVPEGMRNRVHHLLIFHGRYRCKSRQPDCADCRLKEYCNYFKNKNEVEK